MSFAKREGRKEIMKQYLTIDIGGTFIKYSLMDHSYKILEEGKLATEKEPQKFLEQLKSVAVKYKDTINGIAACIAGFINPDTGVNTDFSVGERFRAYNLKKELEMTANVPVILENDSNCAALGEMVCGAAKNISDFCLLTFGTGIGGAIVINNKLFRGQHYKAGEAGLMLLGCSKDNEQINGESAGATSVLVKKVSEAIGEEVDGRYVFEHLFNPVIASIYKTWIYQAATTVGNMAMIIDPEMVLIGGGISHEPQFIKDMEDAVYKLYPHLKQYTKISGCQMGNQAGRIGALYLWLEQNRRDNGYE